MKVNPNRPVAPAAVPNPPGQTARRFGSFSPTGITMYRNGGTLRLEGHLNRSFGATVRYDGAVNSPTRGQFFVSVKPFAGPAGTERPMLKRELRELAAALSRHLKQNPGADPTYELIAKRLDDALAPAGAGRDKDLAALKAKIAAATKNLLFMSESDHPFDQVLMPGAGKPGLKPAEFLKAAKLPANTPVEVASASEFFDQRTRPQEWWGKSERADAAKYRALQKALEGGLTDLRVYRTGEVEIGVYLVGRNQHGDLMGVKTISIET